MAGCCFMTRITCQLDAVKFRSARWPPRRCSSPCDRPSLISSFNLPDSCMRESPAAFVLIPLAPLITRLDEREAPKIPHINARAETVHKVPVFREAVPKRRASIPATSFFDWQARADRPGRSRPRRWRAGYAEQCLSCLTTEPALAVYAQIFMPRSDRGSTTELRPKNPPSGVFDPPQPELSPLSCRSPKLRCWVISPCCASPGARRLC